MCTLYYYRNPTVDENERSLSDMAYFIAIEMISLLNVIKMMNPDN